MPLSVIHAKPLRLRRFAVPHTRCPAQVISREGGYAWQRSHEPSLEAGSYLLG